MKRFMLIAALVPCGCGTWEPTDAERLRGDWVVVDFHSPNATEDRSQRRKHALITEETWSEQFQGTRFEDFEYVVNASATPKELDLIFTNPDGKRLRVRAIYEFTDRGQLRVCFGTPPVVSKDGKPEYVESVRPTSFEPTGGPLIRYCRKTE
ncbi:MAG TPA: TIGR03067 domain-containing protein [Gemmata sp.]